MSRASRWAHRDEGHLPCGHRPLASGEGSDGGDRPDRVGRRDPSRADRAGRRAVLARRCRFSPAGRGRRLRPQRPPQVAARWIAGIALVLAWSVWAWMALCVVIELRSWATGRTPVRLPASRAAQSLAAFLVGTTLAVSTVGRAVSRATGPDGSRGGGPADTTRPTGPDRRPGSHRRPAHGRACRSPRARRRCSSIDRILGHHPGGGAGRVARRAVRACEVGGRQAGRAGRRQWAGSSRRRPIEEPTTSARISEPLAPSMPPDAVVPRTHLVRSRETLWSIAEDELGSALRWHELAQLNYGITQEDGRALDAGHWITPGWRLLLPPERFPRPAARARATRATRADHAGRASPRCRRWGPGPDGPFRAPRSLRIRARDRAGDRAPTSRTSDRTPTPPRHRPSGRYSNPWTASLRAPTPGPVRGRLGGPSLRSPRSVPAWSVPAWSGCSIGCGGSNSGTAPRVATSGCPRATLGRFEQRLRVGDGWVLTHEVETAIRQVARSLSVRPDGLPRVLGVRVHSEVIELVLD